MNKLKTTNTGGMPIVLDDLRWLESAEREALVGVIKTLISYDINAAIISGCDVVDTEQGDMWSCSEGFIFFNNEIFFVPEQLVFNDGNIGNLYFAEDISYESPAGLKTFNNAVPHETYEIRQAQMLYVSGIYPPHPPNTMPAGTDDFITILRERLLLDELFDDGWNEMVLDSTNVNLDGGTLSDISGKMAYKTIGKTMMIAIDLLCTVTVSGSASKKLNIDLPTGHTVKTSSIAKSSVINDILSSVVKLYCLRTDPLKNCILISRFVHSETFATQAYNFQGELFIELSTGGTGGTGG